MVLLIDNYDSFTYNLFQAIAALGQEVKVVKNDEISVGEIDRLKPSHIVISPGPGRPEDGGISLEVVRRFYQRIPILGVCLGHQCIGQVFGAKTVKANRVLHGKTDVIHHDGQGLFAGVPTRFKAARYHSLAIDSVPADFAKRAWSADGTIMAIEHHDYPVLGVQFHPESFMTKGTDQLLRNFLAC